jgi:hypothetical protein
MNKCNVGNYVTKFGAHNVNVNASHHGVAAAKDVQRVEEAADKGLLALFKL